MINLDDLKTEFDKRQQERERCFAAASMRARVMLAEFPPDQLPDAASVTSDCDIFVEWVGASPGTVLFGTFTDEKTYLNRGLRGYPDPETGAELLAEVRAAKAFKEASEICTHCRRRLPTGNADE